MRLLLFTALFFMAFAIAIGLVWRALIWLTIYIRPEKIAQGFAVGIILLFCLMFSYIFAKAAIR